MATLKYQIIRSEFSPYANKDIVEIVMKSDCTTADLPTDVAPGSLAYLVDGRLPVYAFSADGEWEELEV